MIVKAENRWLHRPGTRPGQPRPPAVSTCTEEVDSPLSFGRAIFLFCFYRKVELITSLVRIDGGGGGHSWGQRCKLLETCSLLRALGGRAGGAVSGRDSSQFSKASECVLDGATFSLPTRGGFSHHTWTLWLSLWGQAVTAPKAIAPGGRGNRSLPPQPQGPAPQPPTRHPRNL